MRVDTFRDLAFVFDVHPQDVVLWQTHATKLWDAWAIVGVLTLGATLVIAESFRNHPKLDLLWDLVERHHVNVLCIDPNLIKLPISPSDDKVLPELRVLGSTGGVWSREQWNWLFKHISHYQKPIISFYWSAALVGGILSCTTVTSIKAGTFSGPVPGVAIRIRNAGEHATPTNGHLIVCPNWPGSSIFVADQSDEAKCYSLTGSWFIDDDGYWFDGSTT